MGEYFRKATRLLLLLCICYLAMAQPGIPFCWLHPQACEFHPHLTQAHTETPHLHDYLFEASLITHGLPILLAPFGALLALLSLVCIYRMPAGLHIREDDWVDAIDPPPPRSPVFS